MRRVVLAVAAALLLAAPMVAVRAAHRPLPELNFAKTVLPRPCALANRDPYEAKLYELEGWAAPDYDRYPGDCQRLLFSFGPILVKPGQNDVLIQPITIEKPAYDGYITRFKPDLVRADGSVPPDRAGAPASRHLALGARLRARPVLRRGRGEDHRAVPARLRHAGQGHRSVAAALHGAQRGANADGGLHHLRLDYVAKKVAETKWNMKPAYPIWNDVRPSAYPVFNTQRSFGGADGECSWPREQCAVVRSLRQVRSPGKVVRGTARAPT